jgi:hypothetical protein
MGTSVVDPDLHRGEKSNPDPDQRDADPDSNPDSKRLFQYYIGSGSAALTYSIGNNSVADPDPRLGASIRIRDEQPGSYCLELRIHFFTFWGLKYLSSLMRIRDPGLRQFGSGIRDGKKSDPGSGIDIPDPPHWEISTKIQRMCHTFISQKGSVRSNFQCNSGPHVLSPRHCPTNTQEKTIEQCFGSA